MDNSMDDLPPHRAPRRGSTSPMPRRDSVSSDIPEQDLVETLYSHPNVKIISFTATGRAFARSPAPSNVDPPGTLSWSSQLERTIAVGPFRIYRAPRSVAFLSCGSALQPILRKSQCWCIDEVNSKFILQIRRPNYWRIEVPVDDPEDQQRAEELREVLNNVLQFEKTECPFKRTFTVDLPEQVPITILPWTPRSQPTIPDDVASISSAGSRRSSFVGRTTTPTPSNDRRSDRRPMDIPPSPHIGRPARAASCVVPSNISLYEEYGMHLDPLQPMGGNTGESHSRHLDMVPERSGEHNSYSFLSGLPESYSSPSCVSDVGVLDDTSSLLSTSPTQSDLSVYQLHEGSGNRGGRMKARLRRRTAGFTTTRSATMPPHLMPTIDRSAPAAPTPRASTPRASTPRAPVVRSASETSRRPPPRAPVTPKPVTPKSAGKNAKGESRSSQSAQSNGLVQQPRLQRRDSEESFHSVESWHSTGAVVHHAPPISQTKSANQAKKEPKETDTLSVERWQRQTSRSRGSSPMPCAWESDADSDNSEASQKGATLATEDTVAAEPKAALSTATPPQRPFAPRHRATTSSLSVRRRALSPLPPAADLFTPASTMDRQPYRSKLETVKSLPMAIIAKTCEMIMGPPSSLLRLILRVAAKIASGQWRGLVYGYGEDGEEIPVQWDYSGSEFSDWSDDENQQQNHRSGPGKRHSRHRSKTTNASKGSTGQSELNRRPSSSDDSRSWGVD
ncbi:uncharacterized protein FIESC28_08204 [Fusarium coffeatum]|uniref:Inheritance of peroxisomes protein 1 n=1 Tax=Fusarium coffeatum TaxID=231269 RepID=A0A366R8F1_9HYPO|nr:uncharacterized protein FIESC28_08204 [Fusarium coffeatum]RBR13423.1 hypothetical protein FIESC28_08204 [Fusarium coffeatum]